VAIRGVGGVALVGDGVGELVVVGAELGSNGRGGFGVVVGRALRGGGGFGIDADDGRIVVRV